MTAPSSTAAVTLDSVALNAPDRRPLFAGLTLALGAERVGLVGRNGSGKSSLIAAIAGAIEPAAGSIHRAGRIAVLHQLSPDSMTTVGEALGIAGALACMARIAEGTASDDDHDAADWTLESRIAGALTDTGLPALPLDTPIGTLSGGERTRVMLAAMLLEEPDLLLLDEPTNNLDAEGRSAIAALLAGWRGGALVASHDRALLETMDRIVELTPVGVTAVAGGWSAFVEARDAARARAALALDRAERGAKAEKREAQESLERQARRDAGGRRFAASGSAPKILLGGMKRRAEATAGRNHAAANARIDEAAEHLQAARGAIAIDAPIRIELPPSGLPASRELLRFDAVSLRFVGRTLFENLEFRVRGPERIRIEGPNGSGKTSLLRLAMGVLEPSEGAVWRADVPVALIDQHLSLLDGHATALANIRHHGPGLSEHAARALLAAHGFRNVWADRIASTLSGGERVRLALATIAARAEPPQLLILDEPTNHLDIEASELLAGALGGYDGAILCISHDAAFAAEIGLLRCLSLGRTPQFDIKNIVKQ